MRVVAAAAALSFMIALRCRQHNESGMIQDFGFWLGLACTIICAGYAAAAYHFPKGNAASVGSSGPKLTVVILLTIICMGGVSFDYYDRHQLAPAKELILDYGMSEDRHGFEASVDSSLLAEYEQSDKLLIILRVAWGNIDEMTDRAISKSAPFTITGGIITIVVPAVPGQLDMSSTVGNSLFFYAVLLPDQVSPEQIFSLSDVLNLGGKILSERGIGLPPLTLTKSPPAAPPPSLTPQ